MTGKKYGLFNTKYLGASIYCDDNYKIDALKDYILGKSNNYFVGNNAINEESIEDILLYNTTYYHESRHIHEHLLCPILNYMLRLNILCSLHSFQFFVNCRHTGGKIFNFIPIPLNDWFDLCSEEKKYNIDNWQKWMGIDSVIPPNVKIPENKTLRDLAESIFNNPLNDQDSVNNLIIIASAYYKEYQNFQRVVYDKGNCEYSIRAFLESSAFVHQMTAISLMYGKVGNDYINRIVQSVFKNKQFSVYTGIFTFIYRYLYHTGFDLQYQYAVTSYIIYWCLCGNVLSADSIIDPVKRLDLFTKYDLLHNVTFNQLYNSPLAFFEYWDKKIGSTPIDYNIYKKTLMLEYDKILSALDDYSKNALTDYSLYIKALKKSSFLMIERFIDNPSNFLMPQSYLENIYDYVNIPAHFIVNDKSFIIKLNELKKNESIIRDSVIRGDLVQPEWIASNCPRFNISDKYELLPPTPEDIILTHQLSEKASPYLLLSDALFYPRSVSSPEQIIKQLLPDVEVGFIL